MLYSIKAFFLLYNKIFIYVLFEIIELWFFTIKGIVNLQVCFILPRHSSLIRGYRTIYFILSTILSSFSSPPPEKEVLNKKKRTVTNVDIKIHTVLYIIFNLTKETLWTPMYIFPCYLWYWEYGLYIIFVDMKLMPQPRASNMTGFLNQKYFSIIWISSYEMRFRDFKFRNVRI